MTKPDDAHLSQIALRDSEELLIASVSGLGCGTVIANLLRVASESGHLSDIRKTPKHDQREWFEFRYRSFDGHSSQVIAVATNTQHFVVEAELWRTVTQPEAVSFDGVEGLRRCLRYVHCIESISSVKVNAVGELTEVCLGFTGCAPLRLARQL